MLWIKLIIYLICNGKIGIATTFFSFNDPWNFNPMLACYNRELNDTIDILVAHKSYGCRERVFVYNLRTKLSAVAVVGDRGPVHALVDLSQKMAKMIKSNGMEMVILVPLGP